MKDPVEAMIPSAAALAVAVADYDAEAVAAVFTGMSTTNLHALAIVLAANIDLDRPIRAEPAERDVSDNLTATSIRVAAAMFDTEPMTILALNRQRNVVDARSTAMYACKLLGMSSTAIGARFNRDHSTVVYAWGRVGESSRLRTAGQQIAIQCGWRRESEAS